MSDALLVPGAIASSVGVKEQTGRPIRETLLDELRLRTLLVVLDNCEHHVEVCAALAHDLLRTCPGVRILATSREPLRIHGERAWAGAVIANTGCDCHGYRGRAAEESRGAVVRGPSEPRSVQVHTDGEKQPGCGCHLRPSRWLTPGHRVGAARARVLTPHQILARLDDAFRLLVGGSRTAPTRQQTLRATLDWSYLLLDQAARRRFEALAVFAAGFDLEAAEAIRSGDRDERADALEMPTALVDRSLVMAQPQAGAMRYRLLEPVRQYAEARLVERGAWEPTQRRHAEYLLGLVKAGEEGFKGADHEVWRARLELEHDNVRAVLRRCLGRGRCS